MSIPIIIFILFIAICLFCYHNVAGKFTDRQPTLPTRRPRSSRPPPKISLPPIVPDNKPSTGTKVRFSDINPVREYNKVTGSVTDVAPVPMAAA